MPSLPRVSPWKLVATAAYLLAWPALELGLSGDSRWTEGWILGLWFVALCSTCILWLYRKDPALLAERYRRPGTGGQSGADAAIVFGLMGGFLAWIAVPALDVRRFGWTARFPSWLEGCGAALLLGAALVALLMLRVVGEERVLARELAGYDAYRARVRYRLIPGVW